jgi:AraC family transcriptional regulator of adaptative response / DNA-3-methyladenine glycosylase II
MMAAPNPVEATITTELGLIPPFEVGPAMAMLAAHAVPGAESVDVGAASHTRALATEDGSSIEVTVGLHRGHVTLRHPAIAPDLVKGLVGRVRRWLDLDLDPCAVRATLGGDPLIGPLVTARPGLRVISYPDAFEAAVMSILGQQVSVAAGRTFGGRTVMAFGKPSSSPSGLRMFPGAVELAASNPAELQAAIGVTHARSRTLHALASACVGGLDLDATDDDGSRRAQLLGLPGIGPWTVDYLAVRAWGERDAYPAGDLVLQRALGVRAAAQALAAARNWSPYRAYALFHLWSAALHI